MGFHNKPCFAHIFNLAGRTDQQLNAVRANVQASASDTLQALFILTERDHTVNPDINIGINGFMAVVDEYKRLRPPYNDKDSMILGYAYFNLALLYAHSNGFDFAVKVENYIKLAADTKAPLFVNEPFWQDGNNNEAYQYALEVNRIRSLSKSTTSSSVNNHATNLHIGVDPEQVEPEAICCCVIC